VKQLRQLGYKGYCIGCESFASPRIREIAGEAANGVVFASTYVVPDTIEEAINDIEKNFLIAYEQKFGELPKGECAYRGYDAIMILEEAIKSAKSLKGSDIRDAIENITGLEGLAGNFNFKGNKGNGINGIRIYITYNGKNISFDEYLQKYYKK
jgi:branched-chain amino acid transport system substrate-binding protein